MSLKKNLYTTTEQLTYRCHNWEHTHLTLWLNKFHFVFNWNGRNFIFIQLFVQGCWTKSRQNPLLSISFGASTASEWNDKRNGRTLPEMKLVNYFESKLFCSKVECLLDIVFSIELTSALKVPPHILSSHAFDCGKRSATRAQPINSQSFVHEFGVPWVPPPTCSIKTVFLLIEMMRMELFSFSIRPTIELTRELLFPDRVKARDRFESTVK